MRLMRRLAFTTAGFSYAVIVLGFVVRITGSGMGCGDDWPLCNGRVIPPLDDVATVIEYGHRLAVLGLSGLVLGLLGTAMVQHRQIRAAGAAAGLLVVQALVGALAVRLELPPWTVVIHLSLALALLALLLVLGLRLGSTPAPEMSTGRGGVIAAVALGAATILFGGLTANFEAGWACQGFPLCNGQLWPAGDPDGLVHTHWSHRLVAYALLLHTVGLSLGVRRRHAPAVVQRATWILLGSVLLQTIVAAVMVLAVLPPVWRGLHAAVGTAVWVALVYLGWVALAPSVTSER